MKKIIYLHGMGGSPADWAEVQKFAPGMALPLPLEAKDFSTLCESLVREIQTQNHSSENVILCGYSLGGRVAILIAERLLALGFERLRLVLLATGLGFSAESEAEKRKAKDLEWARVYRNDSEKFWELWYQQDLFSGFAALPQSKRENWLKDRKAINPFTLERQLVNWSPAQHKDLRPLLEQLASKVVVQYIAGTDDKTYSALAKSLSQNAHIQVEILPGIGHILPLEAPEQVARIVSVSAKD